MRRNRLFPSPKERHMSADTLKLKIRNFPAANLLAKITLR